MSSTDVNVLVLSGMFACVVVRSGKKTVLFCENLILLSVFLAVIFCHEHLPSPPCPLCVVSCDRMEAHAVPIHTCIVTFLQNLPPKFCPSPPISSPQTRKTSNHPHEQKTILSRFSPGMQGGYGKRVGRDRHLYGFLLSFEDSPLPWRDSVLHVKTRVLICTSEFD